MGRFLLLLSSEKIRKFFEGNGAKKNLKKLKKAILKIQKPFKKYPRQGFYSASVVVELVITDGCSFFPTNRLQDFEDSLFVADFPIKKKAGKRRGLYPEFFDEKKSGTICLFTDDVAKMFNCGKGKPIIGTWDDVISEYLRFLKDRINI